MSSLLLRQCEVCGREFLKNPAAVLKGQGRFCSLVCVATWRVARANEPDRIAARFWSNVTKIGPMHPVLGTRCHLWTGCVDAGGYGAMTIGKKVVKAHRIAWFVAHGVWPDLDLLHACDNPPCVRVDGHLSEGTQRDNVADMYTKGRCKTVLTESLVQGIRERRSRGDSYESVARWARVSEGTVGNVMRGKIPRHIG